MVTLAYEYSSSKNNNVVMFGTSMLTAAPPLETGTLPDMIYTLHSTGVTLQASDVSLTEHTNKYTTVNGVAVSGIDILTGNVTFSTYQGSGYGNTSSVTGVPVDKEADAMTDPYRVPGRLTIFEGLTPVSYNHPLAH